MRKFFVLIISILLYQAQLHQAHAQGDYDLALRWFNESLYNPAAVGNSFTTSIFVHAREQWAGIKNAPSTQALSLDTYVDKVRSGVGMSILHDKIGITNMYNLRFSYAYYIPITSKSALALGLSGGLLSVKKNAFGSAIDNPADPELAYANFSRVSPDFDFGFEFKGPFKLGGSVRHVGTNYNDDVKNYPVASINYWAYASYRFNANDLLSVEPAASLTHRDKISRYELGAIFYFLKTEKRNKYSDRFWLGGMYRFNQQFALLTGVNVTEKIRIGYAFEYGHGPLASLSKYGTHEMFFAWQFNRIFYREPLCPAYRSYERYNNR